MKLCIICRELKDDFNDEHIIPHSIGGTNMIHSVCKTCNSKLGDNVDKKLVEHFFCVEKRERYNIKSQHGNIPDSLKYQSYYFGDSKEQRIKYVAGKKRFHIVAKVKSTNNFYFDSADLFHISKYCDKNNIDISSLETIDVSGDVKGSVAINRMDFDVALLKIAYEFAVSEVPLYLDDKMAKVISSSIYDVAYKKKKKSELDSRIKYKTSMVENTIGGMLKTYSNSVGVNHLIFLSSARETGLLCHLKIFDCYYFIVQLSEEDYGIDTKVYENKLGNLNNKTESLIEFAVRMNLCF